MQSESDVHDTHTHKNVVLLHCCLLCRKQGYAQMAGAADSNGSYGGGNNPQHPRGGGYGGGRGNYGGGGGGYGGSAGGGGGGGGTIMLAEVTGVHIDMGCIVLESDIIISSKF